MCIGRFSGRSEAEYSRQRRIQEDLDARRELGVIKSKKEGQCGWSNKLWGSAEIESRAGEGQ